MSKKNQLINPNWLTQLLPSWADTDDSRLSLSVNAEDQFRLAKQESVLDQISGDLSLQQGLIDTHCHLDVYEDPETVVRNTENLNIFTIAVTNTPSLYPYTESLTQGSTNIFPALGFHPILVARRKHEVPQMWDYLDRTRFIGEIGLDNQFQDESEYAIQVKVFEEIIERCAQYGNKYISIHSNICNEDVLNIIGENYPGKIIFHWFVGLKGDLERAVNSGHYFSVNWISLAEEESRNLVAEMPRDRVLTETDGPYLLLDGEPMNPKHIMHIVDSLGDIWGLDISEARAQIRNNLMTFLEI